MIALLPPTRFITTIEVVVVFMLQQESTNLNNQFDSVSEDYNLRLHILCQIKQVWLSTDIKAKNPGIDRKLVFLHSSLHNKFKR